ncbi:LOW QUALITY PROTEIN: hypothetical protein CFC21_047202 [Triticum aestivum]|uniref:RNase H type-1 domain-containing protein n=2 Tax=Triticum aestivum TaxID=4565 RepID=A0A3B6GSV6_WHEAT|nr:LOW QUALITY PROTEIN: hypothetical protein CFC21_047202 [Triticum aestivum]
MEMDCKEVVDLWNTRHHSRSVVAPILLEIGDLSASFSSFIINILRLSNLPAHLYAKRACSLQVTEAWTNDVPPFLVSSLMVDCARCAFVE